MAYKSKAMQMWAGENQPASVENNQYKSVAMQRYMAEKAQKAQQEEAERQQALLAQQEAEAPRRATLKDLTVGSLSQGYKSTKYGDVHYNEIMSGREKAKAQRLKEQLDSDKYNFEAQSGLGKAISGASQQIGQWAYQATNPKTLAMAGGAAALATGAGAAVPLPEEIVTVPVALGKGFAAGSAVTMHQVEAANAYDEMVAAGVSDKDAKIVANLIGLGVGALEAIQADKLADSVKLLKGVKGEASQKAATRLAEALSKKQVAKAAGKIAGATAFQTAQEVAQEGVNIAGQNIARKNANVDTISGEEAGQRLKDTAIQSALSFGLLEGAGAVGGAVMNRNNVKTQANEANRAINEAENTPKRASNVEESRKLSNNVEAKENTSELTMSKVIKEIDKLKTDKVISEEEAEFLQRQATEKMLAGVYDNMATEDITEMLMDDIETFDKSKIYADENVDKIKNQLALPEARPTVMYGNKYSGIMEKLPDVTIPKTSDVDEDVRVLVEKYYNNRLTNSDIKSLLSHRKNRTAFEQAIGKKLPETSSETRAFLRQIPTENYMPKGAPNYSPKQARQVAVNTAETISEQPSISNSTKSADVSAITAVENRYGDKGANALRLLSNVNDSKLAEFDRYYRAGTANQQRPADSNILSKNEATAAYMAGMADAKANREAYANKKVAVNKKAGLNMSSATHLTLRERITWDRFAKALGLRISFADTLGDVNAKYDMATGEIVISRKADNFDIVVVHEIVHRLRQTSPNEFYELAQSVLELLESQGKLEGAIAEYGELYGLTEGSIEYFDTMEEIVADFMANEVSTEDLINMVNAKPSVAEKLLKIIEDVIKNLAGLNDAELKQPKAKLQDLHDKMKKAVNASENAVKQGVAKDGKISGERHSYIGSNAMAIDREVMKKARSMAGDNETIRQATGWFKGADGKWRFEIDDSEAVASANGLAGLNDADRNKFKNIVAGEKYKKYADLMEKMFFGDFKESKNILKEIQSIQEKNPDIKEAYKAQNRTIGSLQEFLKHNELYKQYPEIKNMDVVFDIDASSSVKGGYDGRFAIHLNKNLKENEDALKSVLLHEIQHFIQQREGFSNGATPDYWVENLEAGNKQVKLNLYEKYQTEKDAFLSKVVYKSPDYKKMVIQLENSKKDTDEYNNLLNAIGNKLYEDFDENKADALANQLINWVDTMNVYKNYDDSGRMTAMDLYRSTAGEQESRDVEQRMNYTAQQRKEKTPFIKDETTVFVEDERYSKKVYTGKPQQQQIVNAAKTVYPALSDYRNETVYRIITDKEFYKKTGWAYLNGILDFNDAKEFTKIIGQKQIGKYVPKDKRTNLYYPNVNGKIVITDGDFEIPTIFAVLTSKDINYNYDLLWEEINDTRYIILEILELFTATGTLEETVPRDVADYSKVKQRLEYQKTTYSNSPKQQNRGRNSAKNSSFEKEVQSGITRESRKSEPIIPDGYKERGFNESVRTKTDYDDIVQQEFIDNPEIYKQLANKVTKEKAKAIMDKGLAFAETEFPKLLERMDATAIALGDMMAREYSNMGEYDKAVTTIRDMAKQLTKAGQFSQAAVIALTKSNPMTALAYAKRDIDKLNADGHKQFGKKWKDFEITAEEEQMFKNIKQGDADAIKAAYEKINKRIAKEYPSTIWQKFIEASRISMLLNPRTNVKNVVSNLFLYPVTRGSGILSSKLQKVYAYYNKDYKPNQSGLLKKDIRKQAEGVWDKVKDTFDTTSKYNEGIKANKRDIVVFKEGMGTRVMENIAPGTLHKLNSLMNTDDAGLMETLRHATYWLLEYGDNIFVKQNFISRLGSYMQAKGITDINTMSEEDMAAAIEVAYREALRATFKDDTALSKWMASIKHTGNPYIDAMMEMIMPFTKTPANIAMRGIDYSPIGLINTITKAKKGADASEVIDELSKNLFGSALIALGALWFSKGIVTGGEPENEKEAAFLKQQGWQPYAVKVGDGYATYDWAQPAAIPIIMGVTIMESLEEGRLGVVDAVKNAGVASFNQWVELSPLQSLKEVMGGYGTVGENLLNTAIEMPQRLIPSALGATARTADTTQRLTYSKGNVAQTQKDLAKSKIPGLSQTLPAAYDTWGREKKRDDSTGLAALNQFINPSSYKGVNATEADREINRLYNELGDSAIYPRKASYSIEKGGKTYTLSNAEYSEYQRIMGQLSYDGVKALMAKPAYNELTDHEKAEIIKDIYDNAFEKAKYTIMEGQGYKKTEEDIRTAKETKIKQAYLQATPENIAEYYIAYYILNNADSDKTASGTTIAGSKKKNGINRLVELGYSRTEASRLYDRLKG